MTTVLTGDPLRWDTDGCETAVTIGVFDGVHRGHRSVIDRLLRRAELAGLIPTALTFDPHPLRVVAPDRAPKLLTTLDQRLELLAVAGVEIIGVLPFVSVREMDPETFARGVLADALHARLVAVGLDFRFGRGRSGGVGTLRECGARCGYEVAAVDLLDENDSPISSTRIRALIASGDVGEAADILGRPYELRGTVVPGDRRGRTIGFPTANLEVAPDVAVPADGVYAAWSVVEGEVTPAVVNIGVRPTFDGTRRVIEAHLLDTDRDLYGTEMGLRFVARLRGERRFDSVDDLVRQVGADVHLGREILSGNVPEINGGGRR